MDWTKLMWQPSASKCDILRQSSNARHAFPPVSALAQPANASAPAQPANAMAQSQQQRAIVRRRSLRTPEQSISSKPHGSSLSPKHGRSSRTVRKHGIRDLRAHSGGSGPSLAGSQLGAASFAQAALRTVSALLLSAAMLLSVSVGPPDAAALTAPSYSELSRLHYGRPRKVEPGSALPNAKQAETIAELDKDLFTDEAYQGMLEIVKYARYVETQQEAEELPGCELCETNRITLEKAWQVVANEFYDSHHTFSQRDWARTLQATLRDAGGLLKTKHQLHAAAHRMVASLGDPYSEWLPPSEFRRALRKPQPAEREYLALQMTGVGIAVGSHCPAGGWVVEAPMAESPAENAGILRGERILQIDDYHVEGTSLTKDEVTALLRGPTGSQVTVIVAPPSSSGGPARSVPLERRPLPQPPLKQARVGLPGGGEAAVVRVHYFTSGARRAVQQALLEGEIDGVDGYVLDLRNNPGGVFEEAIAIASLLLEQDQMVASTVRTTEGFVDNSFQVGHLSREVFYNLPGTLSRAPLVVLTNAATASASEVLAGALHDNGRAVLVGEQTFGKGVVQYYFPVHGDGGLKLTVAKYLTPKHDISEAGGLMPDIPCSDYPHPGVPSGENDRCMAIALQLLSAQQGPIQRPPLYARAEQSVG
eukprot:CAMPEP_0206145654 /NCGR_PEP_ID=MMETSP1473-20131121/28105_1 /ASSEMBLY_ACC=CAM_ASM_001109 /TAXON_ID=1461547 /ORGANISM="Stichococcus sp, Strain RCC1054" /LENGTH=649 /DNA_ID=CAMNT_0053541937 /DNA_START=262 /DNA_END=2212 /DNA_ORIENTATION=+